MTQWTKEAQELWNRFTEDARTRFDAHDVDLDEILEDMRRHVETEFDTLKLTVVTADDLRKILNRLELPNANPQAAEQNPPAPSVAQTSPRPQVMSSGAVFYVVIFGVLLPFAAVSFELLSRICTSVFFDPLPTIWHVLLFAAIPVFNLAGVLCIRLNKNHSFRWMGFFNAISIGIAAFYTFLFLPLLPFSAIAIILVGIGLCGWAPLLSLTACIMVRKHLRLLTDQPHPRVPYLWKGVAVGVGALVLLTVPNLAIVVGLHMAVSENPDTRTAAYKLMRTFGSDNYLLNRCYDFGEMRPFGVDLTGTDDISTETIRGIYYRVTGEAFNTRRPKMDFFGARDSWLDEWDFDQAGDNVGGRLKNLSLVSSQIDANLQADGVVGYLEWIMVFRNDSQWTQREARCQLQLPPGGVVSRLTLWIDGQECEAAFGGRSKTKGAYQAVVSQRRDPVLVTTKGPDQVLLQCFPIEPNGGKMKVRVGITFPLDLVSKQQALLQLPYINQRNFAIPETTTHQLWIEADHQMTAALKTLAASDNNSGMHTLRGPLTNTQLEQQLAAVHIQRNPEITRVWAKNDFTGAAVLQQLQNQQDPALIEKIVIIVDTSAPMKASLDDIEAAIESGLHDTDFVIVTADDVPETFKPGQWPTWRNAGFKGGKDNMPALIQAWDMAADSNTAIVWIHAGQPHLFDAIEALTQRCSRRPNGPAIFHVQTAPGPNMIVEALDDISQIRTIARSADLKADLERLFGRLRGTMPTYHLSRETFTTNPDPAVKEASSHIVRLWARERVESLRTRDKSKNEAIDLAVQYQLVTPVSGAVVLERKEQYDQHGLEPVDPETVPTIPEPATLLLMGLGAAFLRKRPKIRRNGDHGS